MYPTKTNNCVAAVAAREPPGCLPGRVCALALSTADGCLTCFNCPLGKLNALFTVYETHTIQLSPCLISARQSNRVSIRVDNCEIIFPSGFYDRNDFQWPRVRALQPFPPPSEIQRYWTKEWRVLQVMCMSFNDGIRNKLTYNG